MTKLITGKAMINGVSPKLIEPAVLLVENDRIIALGESALKGADSDTLKIDLKPYVLMPGLIDAHVHLLANGKPGALTGIHLKSDIEMVLQGTANMQEAIEAGITTLRDCGGAAEVVMALREASRSGLVTGPRVIAAGGSVTTTGGHCHYFRLEADGQVEILKAMRNMLKLGVDFFKIMITGGGCTPGSNSAASQYTRDELKLMVAEAHRVGKKITGHAHGTEGIKWAVEAGFDGIEHCSWTDRSGIGISYDEQIVDRMCSQGTVLCKTIAGFQRWPLEELNEQHEGWDGFREFRAMVKKGIPVIAGTDAGIDLTNFAGLCTSMETMAGLGGMDTAAVLDSAGAAAAKALDIDSDVGTLEIGKFADIIAVKQNPHEDLRTLRKIIAVIKGGKLVYTNNNLEEKK